MEQDLVLYKCSDLYDPVIQMVRCWVAFCHIQGYKECESEYYWNAVGNLPVLRYERSVFAKEHILEFLKIAYDINFNLTEEERRESTLLEEICVSKIHPGTIFAMWIDESTSKGFYEKSKSKIWKFLMKPFAKLGFWVEKRNIKDYLKYQHGFTSKTNAFSHIHQAHQLLSEKLGNQAFFFQTMDRANFPRSADITIYAYLLEEIIYLHSHPHVTDSLNSFPNLLNFMKRMKNLLSINNPKKEIPEYSLVYGYFLHPPSNEDQEYYPPAIAIKPYQENNWEQIKYKLQGQTPTLKASVEDATRRRIYVTSVSAILFLFIYLRFNKH
ncbi:unnamed protein product [Blepharisma stoltei]|uniref:Metaxin glutathione S-transferase domain-containing protein n=1 Tax=Blepharisma stoltei TaxID=1481888 RepID=A0AAU9KJ15_9CILI|nr:unnamed protein product [Blepharisma stoltei]